jgi:hypothetical protein
MQYSACRAANQRVGPPLPSLHENPTPYLARWRGEGGQPLANAPGRFTPGVSVISGCWHGMRNALLVAAAPRGVVSYKRDVAWPRRKFIRWFADHPSGALGGQHEAAQAECPNALAPGPGAPRPCDPASNGSAARGRAWWIARGGAAAAFAQMLNLARATEKAPTRALRKPVTQGSCDGGTPPFFIPCSAAGEKRPHIATAAFTTGGRSSLWL